MHIYLYKYILVPSNWLIAYIYYTILYVISRFDGFYIYVILFIYKKCTHLQSFILDVVGFNRFDLIIYIYIYIIMYLFVYTKNKSIIGKWLKVKTLNIFYRKYIFKIIYIYKYIYISVVKSINRE